MSVYIELLLTLYYREMEGGASTNENTEMKVWGGVDLMGYLKRNQMKMKRRENAK